MANTPENAEPNQPDLNGIWKDPYSREALLSPELIEQLRAKVGQYENADKKAAELRALGYVSFPDAVKHIGISEKTLRSRTNQSLELLANYRTDGTKPRGEPEEKLVKGSDLWWSHPTRNLALLHPDYVEGQAKAEQKKRDLFRAGYIEGHKAAKQIGFTVGSLYNRARNINPEAEYLPDGTAPANGQNTALVKGHDLYWMHPYNKNVALFKPEYVQGQVNASLKEKALLAEGYLTPENAASEIGVPLGSLLRRGRTLEPDKLYDAEGAPITADSAADVPKYHGHQLQWKNPYTDKTSLYSPIYIKAHKAIEQKVQELIAAGYVPIEEVAKKCGVNRQKISQRAYLIRREETYRKDGTRPSPSETKDLVKGSDLVWQHPHSHYVTLLSKEYAAGMIAAFQTRESLIKAGYKFIDEWSAETGIKKTTLYSRARGCDDNEDYLPDGRKATKADKGQPTVKGATLRWQDPYSTEGWLIAPHYVQAQADADRKYKELVGKGYLSYSQTPDEYLTESAAKFKGANIDPNTMYHKDGSLAAGEAGDVTIKGSELKWQHPFDDSVLLHPSLVESWRKDSKAWATGKIKKDPKPGSQTYLKIAAGYKTISDAASEIGIKEATLRPHVISLKPDLTYNDYGWIIENPAEGEGMPGSELVWQSDEDGRGIYYVHPRLIAAYKTATEKHAQLIEQGYFPLESAVELIGDSVSTISARLRNIDPNARYYLNGRPAEEKTILPTILGAELKWINPISGAVLLHPDYVKAHKAVKEKHAELIDKGYLTVAEAAILIGIEEGTMGARIKNVKSEARYHPNGLPAEDTATSTTLLGTELKWISPTNRVILLHPDYVAAQKAAQERQTELIGKGYLDTAKAAKEIGIAAINLRDTMSRVKDEKAYPIHSADNVIVEMKGDEIRYSNPYSTGTVINPIYVKGYAAAEKKHKQLVQDGYIYFADAAQKLGIDKRKLSYLTAKIASEGTYSPDGQSVVAETPGAVKGEQLRWGHPFDTHVVLFHPDFVEKLRQRLQDMERAIEKENELIGKGYFTIEAAAEYTSIDYGSLVPRLKKYKPEGYYSAAGVPVAADSPQAIQGKELIFRPSSGKGVLLHPSLVTRWKQEKDASTMVAKGATSEKIGDAPKLPPDVVQALEKKELGTTPEVGS